MPVLGDTALESVRLLAGATAAFVDLCLVDMEPNPEACEAAVEKSLSMVTGLNPYIGYEQAAALAKEAFQHGQDHPRAVPRKEGFGGRQAQRSP